MAVTRGEQDHAHPPSGVVRRTVHRLRSVREVTGIPEISMSFETWQRHRADAHSQILTLSRETGYPPPLVSIPSLVLVV